MSNYVFLENELGVGPMPMSATYTFATSASINPTFPVGYEVRCVDLQSGSTPSLGAGVFVHAIGSDVSAAGLFVYLTNGSAVKLAAAQPTPVGIAAGALSASNVAGWVQVYGACDYARGTNSAVATNAALFIAGTAGIAQTASVAGSRIMGAIPSAAYTSSQSNSMSIQLNRPWVMNLTASI
jgi:hypothetical protein